MGGEKYVDRICGLPGHKVKCIENGSSRKLNLKLLVKKKKNKESALLYNRFKNILSLVSRLVYWKLYDKSHAIT